MLYTRKGDNGTTKIFGCDQSLSKSSVIAEALGAVDEINSYLGLVKMRVGESQTRIITEIQQDLFIIQAELAGADKHLSGGRIDFLEKVISEIEESLPPIHSFSLSGGTEQSAVCDIARTIARRAERRVVAAREEGLEKINSETLAYLNRLSSLLYAMARLANAQVGQREEAPHY
jgi:cob(I)alamin adenosyltransferase